MVQVQQMTKPGESTTLTRASAQWRTRPADERYDSIQSLRDAAHAFRAASLEETLNIGKMSMRYEGDEILLDSRPMNHWAFGQFCSTLRVPANYMRSIPASLAMQNLRHGLDQIGDDSNRKLLVTPGNRIGAFTGDGYERIWNAEIADWLLELQAEQPWWTFPVSFQTAGGGQKSNAWGESKVLPVAFLSDRDMFVFLCDYEHAIEVPGSMTPLSRGFWVENNEVGAGSVRITMFLFDFVCSNVLVWGARNVIEVKVAHKGRARERVLFEDSEARQAIIDYANRSSEGDTQRIARAQNMLVADTSTEVVDLLYSRRLPGLSKGVIEKAMIIAEGTERYQTGAGPTSVWAVINGLTEVSQANEHADARIEIDRSAAKLLDAMVPLED